MKQQKASRAFILVIGDGQLSVRKAINEPKDLPIDAPRVGYARSEVVAADKCLELRAAKSIP